MKMKILLFASLAILILSSCHEKNTIQNNFNYRINFNDSSYEINNENDLRDFVLEAIGDDNAVLKKFTRETLLDKNSSGFEAITAKYSIKETTVSLVIPLSITSEKINNKFSFIANCTMDCTALTGCSSCNQTVYEPCRRQTCSCTTNSSWGCTSSISF